MILTLCQTMPSPLGGPGGLDQGDGTLSRNLGGGLYGVVGGVVSGRLINN
jgi:hypothetical protein